MLFGSLRASFDGKVDSKQSDDLILEEEEPKWNAVVGMEDPNESDKGEEDGGHHTMVNQMLAYSFAVLVAGTLLA